MKDTNRYGERGISLWCDPESEFKARREREKLGEDDEWDGNKIGRGRGMVQPRHRMNRRHGIYDIRFRFRSEEWVQSCFSAADHFLYDVLRNITVMISCTHTSKYIMKHYRQTRSRKNAHEDHSALLWSFGSLYKVLCGHGMHYNLYQWQAIEKKT